MSNEATSPGPGTVYTETMVHSPPEAFVDDAPYQLAIVTLDAGGRLTVRIIGEARIGDHVEFAEFNNGIPYYRKAE